MQWIRRRKKAGADPDAASVRRVGWRLAGLTVALVSVLLLIAGILVYITTQRALMQSLEDTLQTRARSVLDCLQHPSGRPCNGRDSQGVGYAVVDQNLSLVNLFSSSGPLDPLDPPLTDTTAAQNILNGSASILGSESRGGHDFLMFSTAVSITLFPSGQQVPGVLQVSISEQQYEDTLASLRADLLAISVFGILASAGISAVLARRALKPIQLSLKRQRDFVADAAHELRTPLTIMRTAAELGLADESMVEQQRALEQTLDQNNHLTRLVESLSLLARADSGAIAIEHLAVDFSQIVDDSVEAVDMLAEDRGIRLSGKSQPGLNVIGDVGRLRQLLLILLDNALKYTPEGGSVFVQADTQGSYARLQVRDTGSGIDPADLPRLFERFYRADKARTGAGSGLGLAIGRWIADAHNGRISAANAPGGGAIFTVLLPLAR